MSTPTIVSSASTLWYALQTKPRKEQQVLTYLTARHVEVFYPCMRVKPVNPRSATIRSYFPNYMFVHVCLDETGKNALQWTPGSVGLVSFGGEPAPVPDNFVSELKQHLVELKVIEKARRSNFKHGEEVRIIDGPFVGYHALFDVYLNDEDRAQVLLRWLGRQVRTQVEARHLTR